eukprot:ANDGO_07504.mRNA.1 Proteasome activator 28
MVDSVDKHEAARLHQSMKDLHKELWKKSEEIVLIRFPRKVESLRHFEQVSREYSDSCAFSLPDGGTAVLPPPEAKRFKGSDQGAHSHGHLHTEEVPSNPLFVKLVASVRNEIVEAIDMFHTVKLWVQLNVPKIEDGNNFGVSVQEEIINELSRTEESLFAWMDLSCKGFASRGKLVSKCIKYPGVEDYRRSVDALDHKLYMDMRMCGFDLRNNYSALYDLITKNFEKLKKPKSDQPTGSMF